MDDKLKERFWDHPAFITAVGIMLGIVGGFGLMPLAWAIGRWHCYWFASAPICQ